MRVFGLSLVILAAGAWGAQAQTQVQTSACPAPKEMSFEATGKIYVSVPGFTEGLEVHDHNLFESTGALGGGTRLMKIAPEGHVTVINDPDQKYFGEGLTFLNGRAYQLSWQDHKVFVYDPNFNVVETLPNPHDGWGLTNDGHQLIASDGSQHIFFVDPAKYHITHDITVRRGASEINQINELEYADGEIYANIWMTREIVRINPQSGCIDAEADMNPLWDRLTDAERSQIASNPDYVLNGIAYDAGQKLFYVTGKDWPMIFEGRFTGG